MRPAVRGAALVMLIGLTVASCDQGAPADPSATPVQDGGQEDGGQQDGVQQDAAQLAQNDPPPPTAADFAAMNTAPDGEWASAPDPSFDLTIHAASPVARADAGTGDRGGWRDVLFCMRRFAGQAYDTGGTSLYDDCGLARVPAGSTDVMKLWASAPAPDGGRRSLLVAFAGTRLGTPHAPGTLPALGDVLRDLQSQQPVWHVNPLDGALPAMPGVGAGWDARWHNQAVKLKDTLDAYAEDARLHGNALDVYVVGHSLGAVTATLAGYDIDRYLGSKGWGTSGGFEVQVFAFNPPRLGGDSARARYQEALFARSCPAREARSCLLLRQLTRSLDAVESVPVAMHHPVWDTPSPSRKCAFTVGDGSHAGDDLGYCSQINVPSKSVLNPVANHTIWAWDSQLVTLEDAELADGMFRVW